MNTETEDHIIKEYQAKTSNTSTICRTIAFGLIGTIWAFYIKDGMLSIKEASLMIGLFAVYLFLDVLQYFITSMMYAYSFFYNDKIGDIDKFIDKIDMTSLIVFAIKIVYLVCTTVFTFVTFFVIATDYKISSCNFNWDSISAIATAVMAIATFVAIHYSRKQVNEMKRQWDESNRAVLDFSVVVEKKHYMLKIENTGMRTAYNVCIDICDSFIDKMLIDEFKNELKKLKTIKKTFPKSRIMYFPLSPIEHNKKTEIPTKGKTYTNNEVNENLKYLLVEPLIIKGTYNDVEKIDEYIVIESYAGYAKIPTTLESGLKGISDEIHSISEIIKTEDVQEVGCADDIKNLNLPIKDKQ